jgi:predicted kinase
MLVLITGLPGAGKTTFALALAETWGAVHLNTDRVRAALGLRGHYDSASKQQVYTRLLELLQAHLEAGERAIVDATLFRPALRQPFTDLAAKLRVPLRWIEIRADEAVIRERLQKKRPFSEADFEVYLKLKALYEPLLIPHLILYSDQRPLDQLVQEAIVYLETPVP